MAVSMQKASGLVPAGAPTQLSPSGRLAARPAWAQVSVIKLMPFEPPPRQTDPIKLLERQAETGVPGWCRSARLAACSFRRSRSIGGR